MDLNDTFDDRDDEILDLDALVDAAGPTYAETKMAASFEALARSLSRPGGYFMVEAVAPKLSAAAHGAVPFVSTRAGMLDLLDKSGAAAGLTSTFAVAAKAMAPKVTLASEAMMPPISKIVAPSVASMMDTIGAGVMAGSGVQVASLADSVKQLSGAYLPIDSAVFAEGSRVTQSMLQFAEMPSSLDAFISMRDLASTTLGFTAPGSLPSSWVDSVITGTVGPSSVDDLIWGVGERSRDLDAVLSRHVLDAGPGPVVEAWVPAPTVPAETAPAVAAPLEGWVKVGVVFAGWDALLSTASTVIQLVDRLS